MGVNIGNLRLEDRIIHRRAKAHGIVTIKGR